MLPSAWQSSLTPERVNNGTLRNGYSALTGSCLVDDIKVCLFVGLLDAVQTEIEEWHISRLRLFSRWCALAFSPWVGYSAEEVGRSAVRGPWKEARL